MSPRNSRRIAQLLPAAQKAAQWDGFATIYRQMSRIVRNRKDAYLPTVLSDRLSEALCDLLVRYTDKEAEFAEHALAIIGNTDGGEIFGPELMRAAYSDRDFLAVANDNGPRLPPPMQSIVETLRRLRDANHLHRTLVGIPTTACVGGSIGYAPFYRIYGNNPGRPASDLDVLLTVKDENDLLSAVKRLADLPGVDPASTFELEQRAQVFVDNYSAEDTILSHKLKMWSTQDDPMMEWVPSHPEYVISLHIFTAPAFRHVLVDSCTSLRSDLMGTTRTLVDFRQQRSKREDHQRTLAGRDHFTPAVVIDAISGVLLKSRVYYIDVEDRYCPGLIQTILLIPDSLHWDELDFGPAVDRFKDKMARRLALEQSKWPHEHLSVSLAHIRHAYFAPRIRKAFDDQFG